MKTNFPSLIDGTSDRLYSIFHQCIASDMSRRAIFDESRRGREHDELMAYGKRLRRSEFDSLYSIDIANSGYVVLMHDESEKTLYSKLSLHEFVELDLSKSGKDAGPKSSMRSMATRAVGVGLFAVSKALAGGTGILMPTSPMLSASDRLQAPTPFRSGSDILSAKSAAFRMMSKIPGVRRWARKKGQALEESPAMKMTRELNTFSVLLHMVTPIILDLKSTKSIAIGKSSFDYIPTVPASHSLIKVGRIDTPGRHQLHSVLDSRGSNTVSTASIANPAFLEEWGFFGTGDGTRSFPVRRFTLHNDSPAVDVSSITAIKPSDFQIPLRKYQMGDLDAESYYERITLIKNGVADTQEARAHYFGKSDSEAAA